MAMLSGDPWMQAALQEGVGDFFDTHMMPVCYPDVDVSTLDKHEKKEMRTIVKSIQYGLAFGRQAPAIAKALGLPVQDAQAIIDNYFKAAPKFEEWREKVMEAAINPAKRDMLINPFGRRFQSEIITYRNEANIQREALSFLPQSTASDCCLTAAIRVDSMLEQIPEAECGIINLVHDAIMVEGPEDMLNKLGPFVAQEMRKVGEEMLGPEVPFLTDWSVARSWEGLS